MPLPALLLIAPLSADVTPDAGNLPHLSGARDLGIRDVKFTTQKFYATCLRRIEATVGNRLIRNLTKADSKKWYKEWRKPEVTIGKDGKPIVGKERIDRAHDTISMVRTVIYFMNSIGNEECASVARRLEKIKFEKGAARDGEFTYQHVSAFIRTAFELSQKGVIPHKRALTMSIGVAAQFELMLRQMISSANGRRSAPGGSCRTALWRRICRRLRRSSSGPASSPGSRRRYRGRGGWRRAQDDPRRAHPRRRAHHARYIRRRSERITGAVADLRSAKRASETDDGTAHEPRVKITSESQEGSQVKSRG
jgi:hypothetical protein